MKISNRLLLLFLTVGFFSFCSNPGKHPQPTQGQTQLHQSESAESQNNRQQWIQSMHRSAPGIDWTAIEAANLSAKVTRLKNKPTTHKSYAYESFADGLIQAEWQERGPSNQAGNIKATLHDPSDDRIFALTGGGTLIKGGIDGNSWEVINQDYQFNSDYISSITSNNGTRLIVRSGKIPMYSDDGGYNWTASSGITMSDGTWGRTFLAISDDDMVILALSKKDHWSKYKLYRSLDQGESFQEIYLFDDSNNDHYALFKTIGTNDLYLVQKIDNKYRLFKYRYALQNITIENDDFLGNHDTELVLHPSSVQTEAGLNRHYFYDTDKQVLFTEDEGITASLTGVMPAEPWSLIYALPSDPDVLLMGEVDAYRSTNAGQTWRKVNGWAEYYDDIINKLHADIMSFREILLNDGTNVVLTGHHGGLSKSYTSLAENENITLDGVSTAQFYDVRTDPTDSDIIYASSQDQGFQRSSITPIDGIYKFDQLVSGDYGKIAFTNDKQSLWTVYPGGDIAYFPSAKNSPWPSKWYTIDSEEESVWLPPITSNANSTADEILVAGGNINGGAGSYLIKLINESSEIRAEQFEYNFAQTLDNGVISSVAISALNNNKLYVATSGGAFIYSEDNGQSWTRGFSNVPDGHYLYGAAALPSKTNENIVFIGGSGYSNPAVLISEDGGKNFFPMNTGMPSTLVFDLDMSSDGNYIFAATEAGPYLFLASENRWYDINGIDAPRQSYWSVEYLENEGVARFGTYGRGVWDFRIEQTQVSTKTLVDLPGEFRIFPNPTSSKLLLEAISTERFIQPSYFIINPKGQRIKEGTLAAGKQLKEVIDLNEFIAGAYYLQIRDQGKTKSIPFLKL